MDKRPIVYRATKMTGLYKDEMVYASRKSNRGLRNFGFRVLDPVEIEGIENVHELLEQTDKERLKIFWARDKMCLQECHLVLDDRSCNKSDGVGVELGLARFAYWKPVIRILPNVGFCISALEYDMVFETFDEALIFMAARFGTTKQLLKWRIRMLLTSLPKFIWLQTKFLLDLL